MKLQILNRRRESRITREGGKRKKKRFQRINKSKKKKFSLSVDQSVRSVEKQPIQWRLVDGVNSKRDKAGTRRDHSCRGVRRHLADSYSKRLQKRPCSSSF